MQYEEARKLFNRAAYKEKGKKLENNTYLHAVENGFAVRLHKTDVVTIHKDGSHTLNSGGWKTMTTKERLHKYTPSGVVVYQHKGAWYVDLRPPFVDGGNEQTYPFADGIRIYPDATVTGAGNTPSPKMRKEVRRYCGRFVSELLDGNIGKPGPGDCFFCQMEDPDTAIDANPDHLLSHVEENYYVPSLMVKAMKTMRPSPVALMLINKGMQGYPAGTTERSMVEDQIVRCLFRYCMRILGQPG